MSTDKFSWSSTILIFFQINSSFFFFFFSFFSFSILYRIYCRVINEISRFFVSPPPLSLNQLYFMIDISFLGSNLGYFYLMFNITLNSKLFMFLMIGPYLFIAKVAISWKLFFLSFLFFFSLNFLFHLEMTPSYFNPFCLLTFP